MDTANKKPLNFLYTSPENRDDIQEFIKIAANMIKLNKRVLLFTRQHVDFISALIGLTKRQMQHFIISYHSDVDKVIEKLLELHDWTIVPDFVILNLNSFYSSPNEQEDDNSGPEFHKICFCISTLFNYMRCLETQKPVKSLVLLNSHQNVKLQLLIDFYFYKMAAFNEIESLRNIILD